MQNFILADQQELTAFALTTLIREQEGVTLHQAENKEQLMNQLQQKEESVVVIDYTLFDIQDEEQLMIIISRFPQAHWLMVSDDLTPQVMRKLVYPECQHYLQGLPLELIPPCPQLCDA